jgi:hypothetical protein
MTRCRRTLARVPALLCSMKRIWKGTPDENGLSARREKEVQRWEQALVAHHPQAYAALATVPAVTDPDVSGRRGRWLADG